VSKSTNHILADDLEFQVFLVDIARIRRNRTLKASIQVILAVAVYLPKIRMV
jgi:hypothetical protein